MKVDAYIGPSTTDRTRARRLWFGLAAAPAALVVHETAASAIAGWACADGELALGGLSAAGIRVVLVVLTILAVVIAAAGLIIASKNWRHVWNSSRGTEAWSRNMGGFMAMAGILVSALVLVGLLYSGLTFLFVQVCGTMK